MLPFTNTCKRDTPAPQSVRAIDRFGHLAEFNKRLLIGNLLGDPKADTHVCRLPAHCDIRVQAFLMGIAFVQLYKVFEFRGMGTFSQRRDRGLEISE